MDEQRRARVGFTLVEVVVAIGVLALAAGAAATVRSMADAGRIGDAARIAENRRERAYASTCAASAGVDSAHGARILWSASPVASGLWITQTIMLPHSASIDIMAAGACR